MKERRETSFRLIDKYATYMPHNSWESGKLGGRATKKLIAYRLNRQTGSGANIAAIYFILLKFAKQYPDINKKMIVL